MAVDLKDTAQFSVQGARFRRLNPDGTQPLPTRHVTKIPTFDASGFGGNIAQIIVKEDNGTEITKNVDFSGAADPSAVTGAEAVTALTVGSELDDYTITVEVATGRVLFVYSGGGTPSVVQIYGECAGMLGIGNTVLGSSLGTKFKKFFESVTSLGRGKNVKEGEEIEAEAGDGTLWIVRTSSILKGENVTYNMLKDDDEFKELIMGGIYDGSAETYIYPDTDQVEQPKFKMESFVPKYAQGTNDRTDLVGYTQNEHYSCTGMEGDISNEAKAWATLAYNISALEWTDAAGNKQSSVKKSDLTVGAFEALNVETV